MNSGSIGSSGTNGQVRPIILAPARVLKTRSRPVGPEDRPKLEALIPDLLATMYHAPGIGLAAPQVGIGLAVTVIDLMPDEKPRPLVLINPKVILASSELTTREEGCLSLPGQYAEVSRAARVSVGYLDLDGNEHRIDADGLLAVCLQHEIDHLNGVLFIDHISALKRNIILRRLAKERRQKESQPA
ncbi:MAG: peptide deformylase [Acetobacteraceae bacterium]